MKHSNHNNQLARRGVLPLAAMLLLSANAFAQNTWTNMAGGNWTTGANWLQGTAPNATGAIADFSQAGISSDTTVHLDAPQTAGSLIFGNATPANWILDNNGNPADILTMATSSGTPTIIVTNMATVSATLAGTAGLAIGGSGAGTLVLSSGAYSGQTTISNETVVLGAKNVLSTNDLWFGGSAVSNGAAATLYLGGSGQTVSNLVTSGTAVAANSSSTTAATIVITNGQTLNVQGSALFGYLNSSTIFTNNVVLTGGGNFVQQLSPLAAPNTPLSFQVGACNLTSGQSGPRANVDMSGLASASINLSTNNAAGGVYYPTGVGSVAGTTAGSFIVGDAMKSNAGGEICSLTLASNTTVTANMLVVGYERVQGVVETLVLGAGSNVFNVNTNSLAAPPGFNGREGGRMFFKTPTGSIKIRAQDGVSRAVFYVAGSETGSGGVTLTGPTVPGGYGGMISPQYADFSGHYADLLFSSLVVGDEKHGVANYPLSNWTNYFSFDTGILDTTGLRMGITSGTPSGTNYYLNVCNLNGGTVVIGVNGITNALFPAINSTTTGFLYTNDTYLNIGGATVTVNGNIMAALQNNTNGNAYLDSTITITNGSLTVGGDIYCGRTSTTIVGTPIAPRVVTLTLNGGMLDMTGHLIGSNPYGGTVTNNYVDVLNFLAGTLQNIGQLNNGTVPMVKNGPGTLTLSGVSSYTGGTVVSNGTLVVNHDSALGSNDVTVASGATLEFQGGVMNQYNNPSARLIIAPGANPVNLAYSGSDRVSALSFDGGATFQAAGTWGSSASGAANQDNTHFSGTGILAVTTAAGVTLSSSASSSVYGQPLVLTATVTGASGTPTGTVTFNYGSTVLGTATLTGAGTASITNSTLPAGTDSIVASYSGDVTYTPAVSAALAQVISAPAIAVTGANLTLNYNNSIVGTNYVLISTPSLTPPVTWTPVFTNAGTGGTLTFTIPFNASTPQQFFRYQLQ